MIKQHTYGSGEFYFAPFKPGTQTPGALRYIGNTPEFTLASEQETLEHMDSDHGVREEDDSITTSTTQSGTVVTDNINTENVALFFMGTSSSLAIASATGLIDTISEVEFGVYQLGVTETLPTGVRRVSNVVVTDGVGGSPVTYTAGEDYVVDAERGLIEILEGGALEKGDPVRIVYDNAASIRDQVISSNKTVEGKVFFKSFNARGPQRDYMFPWVKMTPNGDFPLKGDEWLQLPFSLRVLKKGSLARAYADGVAITN